MTKRTQIKILVDAANRGIAARQMLLELFPADTMLVLETGESLPLTSKEINWAKEFRSRGTRDKTSGN
jgi:hypothetical protein